MRRLFFLLGILYMMRSLTMYVTVLPIASKTYVCSPKANYTSASLITLRALRLFSGKLSMMDQSMMDVHELFRISRNGFIDQRSACLLRRLHL